MPTPANWRYTFSRKINRYEKSEDVKALQIALKIDGCFPRGQTETGYYGAITQDAVKKYYSKYKIDNSIILAYINGRWVGPKMLAHLNSKFSK